MIITSFLQVVYPLKYPSNACLSCLDNGSCYWNVIYLECQNVIGVFLISWCLAKIYKILKALKYQSIADMPSID